MAAVAVVRHAASIVWMLVALASLWLLLQQHPQYREDNERREEEGERTPREQGEGGRRKEEAERPGGDGQGSEDEQENQYHGAGNRPSRVRALDAGRVILAGVHLASLLNPLAYDPAGLATALGRSEQAETSMSGRKRLRQYRESVHS